MDHGSNQALIHDPTQALDRIWIWIRIMDWVVALAGNRSHVVQNSQMEINDGNIDRNIDVDSHSEPEVTR